MDIKPWFGFFLFSLILLSLQAHPGIGLVYDGDQTLYYTDLNHVWELNTKTGEAHIYIENIHTHELALDAEGNLYGEHYWYVESQEQFWNYIWVKPKDSPLEKIRGDLEGENEDFSFVRDSGFASYTIRPNNGRYEIVRTDSVRQHSWHKVDLNRPGWPFVSPGGKLYFSDYPRLYAATPEGVEIITEDLSSSRFPFSLQDKTHHIYGIWQDMADAVYVALYGGRQVVRINPEKKIERVLKTGLSWSPVNGIFDKENHLWLMEARLDGVVRVRKISMTQLMPGSSFGTENIVLLLALLVILGIILFCRNKYSRSRP